MNNINSVNRARINIMTIKKNSIVNNTNKIDEVKKINPSNNNGNSENSTLSNDYFYDKLKKLKKEYEEFNLNKNPQKENEKNKEIFSNEYIELLKTIKNLITKYNISILYIKKLNLTTGEYYIKRISNILLENQDTLFSIGISLNKDHFLEINEEKFKSNIDKNKDSVYSFFDLENGLVKKIYTEFKNIKDILIKENLEKEGSLFNEKY